MPKSNKIDPGLHLTLEQHKLIKAAADRLGMSIAGFIRSSALREADVVLNGRKERESK